MILSVGATYFFVPCVQRFVCVLIAFAIYPITCLPVKKLMVQLKGDHQDQDNFAFYEFLVS